MKIYRLSIAIVIFGWMIPVDVSAQFITLDWKLHDAGEVRQLITNRGHLNKTNTGYPGLVNTEFPAGSQMEHLGATGHYYGGITSRGDTLTSNTTLFQNSDQFIGYSGEPWDTVWVVRRGDTLDIPYKPNYTAVSDLDMVTRYNDYNEASIRASQHYPMYLDIIHTTYGWNSPPLDDILIHTFEVTINEEAAPDDYYIEEFYTGFFSSPAMGERHGPGFGFSQFPLLHYIREDRLTLVSDRPKNQEPANVNPYGIKVVPPENYDEEDLTDMWIWAPRFPVAPADTDPARWRQMAGGTIMQDEIADGNHSHFITSVGPFDLAPGDTITWRIGQLHGFTPDDIMQNAVMTDTLVQRDFRIPSPPPVPNTFLETDDRRVVLRWEDNAEDYEDPNRADGEEKPFQGYRVWKSTVSADGPWTLLAQYDLDTGLEYEFTDLGLMNNIQYYYAVQSYSKPDEMLGFPSQFTSRTSNVLRATPGTAPPDHVDNVAVVPNPYRGDENYQDYNPAWESPPPGRARWLEQDRRIQFINLPSRTEINIYTLSGRHVRTLQHDHPDRGFTEWDLTSRVGQAVSSGIYMFTARNLDTGQVEAGKFVIIK